MAKRTIKREGRVECSWRSVKTHRGSLQVLPRGLGALASPTNEPRRSFGERAIKFPFPYFIPLDLTAQKYPLHAWYGTHNQTTPLFLARLNIPGY